MKLTGRVTSVKTAHTATVLVGSTKTHPLYKKSFVSSKKYLADDSQGVKLGDIVEIEKVRPISKNKHWRIIKIVGRNIEEIVNEELKESVAEAIGEVMPASPDELARQGGSEVKDEDQEGSNESEGSEESKVEKPKRVRKEKS